ncbi:MAG: hypothetical protein HY742_09015 [Deltaproteobacteria bacterium]|nr:hypothetical protein [Deltaproteobacteria bacterium]
MKGKNVVALVVALVFVTSIFGCASSHKKAAVLASPVVDKSDNTLSTAKSDRLSQGREKCLADGGRVFIESYPDKSSAELCMTQVSHTFDDGQQQVTHFCPLGNYLDDTCDADAAKDWPWPWPGPLFPPTPTPDNTVNAYFHDKVQDIMTKVKNTGYAHNKNDNFSLVPDYTEITKPQTEYNLFLDCSGFVGYYVIQGLIPKLYQVATPSNYACQTRPLAADFADLLAKAPQVDADHPEATKDDISNGNVCWGQVKHAKNIKPGDVIAYKHPDNIESSKKECTDKRHVHIVTGNTGHILFAHSSAEESKRCKENPFSCGKKQLALPGEWQWVVLVADSTTSPHTADTRKKGFKTSAYKENTYTAWEKGKGGTEECVVERCANGTYHHSCFSKGSSAVEFTKIDTTHAMHPTGIGVGAMYIGPDLKSYRSSYTTDTYHYKNKDGDKEQVVFIGRPIKCK